MNPFKKIRELEGKNIELKAKNEGLERELERYKDYYNDIFRKHNTICSNLIEYLKIYGKQLNEPVDKIVPYYANTTPKDWGLSEEYIIPEIRICRSHF